MSFRTQRLQNRFPLWTKVRKDPSSLGARLFDTFAEGLEENNITTKRLVDEFYLGKRNIGKSFLYEIILDDVDILEPVETATGFEWNYPALTGTIGENSYSIERVATLTDLLMAMPTRITLLETLDTSDRVIWQSTLPFVYSTFPYTERLWIAITDSTFYVNKTVRSDRDKSGLACIVIEGIDQDFNTIKEVVNILDDGIFITASAFKQVTSVIPEGFNGNIVISAGPVNELFELDPYRTLILDDLEGPLKIVLESNIESFVTYKSDRFKLGRQYRQPGIETVSNVEDLASLLLQDSSENTYEAVSLAINPFNTYLYILDTTGTIHIYDHSLPEFIAPVDQDTVASYVEIEPLRPYSKYGLTEYLWTRFARMKIPISFIKIKRTAPDGTITYLQTDKVTWGSETEIRYSFTGRNTFDTWKDFRFQTIYDQTGTWEYNLIVKTEKDLTNYVTSVICGVLVADVSLSTGILDANLLYFSDDGTLVLDNGSNAYKFDLFVDKYIIDERSSRIWLADDYDIVQVE